VNSDKEQLLMRAENLIALGIPPERVDEMLSFPLGGLSNRNRDPKECLDENAEGAGKWRDQEVNEAFAVLAYFALHPLRELGERCVLGLAYIET
jgi:hypothetical protein